MKAVTVDQTSVRTAADAQDRAADRVGEQASAEGLDTSSLTPVFGLIGAGFLAALADVRQQRSTTLAAAEQAHRTASTTTKAACCAYTCCDATSAAGMTA
ncbi:hypothetical protein nbrc107696_24320 [Gordonia spumicola]|uniref:ESX-1 secretion-associated protein n=1 Tax=Gordonia spumicola TaxID=589161 RepID=A0A7I9V9A2_9ACTN|nr:type VII secretion target [Gordonia spumicola]GEE01986.1 hypothetical protein nbrc107696_24320 [Gordonia spumicola]